jgi:hypothetical protein
MELTIMKMYRKLAVYFGSRASGVIKRDRGRDAGEYSLLPPETRKGTIYSTKMSARSIYLHCVLYICYMYDKI